MAFSDRQAAVACQPRYLAGRHRAPTGAPTPVGGEGTQSPEAVACPAGVPAMFEVSP